MSDTPTEQEITEPDKPDKPGDWAIYSRLLGYVRPHWLIFILAVLGYLMGSSAEAYFAKLFGDLVAQGLDRDPQLLGGGARVGLLGALTILRQLGQLQAEVPPLAVADDVQLDPGARGGRGDPVA